MHYEIMPLGQSGRQSVLTMSQGQIASSSPSSSCHAVTSRSLARILASSWQVSDENHQQGLRCTDGPCNLQHIPCSKCQVGRVARGSAGHATAAIKTVHTSSLGSLSVMGTCREREIPCTTYSAQMAD